MDQHKVGDLLRNGRKVMHVLQKENLNSVAFICIQPSLFWCNFSKQYTFTYLLNYSATV